MTARTRRISAAFMAVVLLLVPIGAAGAQTNSVEAINEKDGTSVFEFAFDVVKTTEEVVAPINQAVAYSSCESCQTVAVAIQVVLVMSSPDVVAPQNVAVAVNYECDLCETFAVAYQFVVGIGGGPIEFTDDGKDRFKDLQKDLKDLWKSDLPIEAFLAELDVLMDELRDILKTELVPAKEDDDSDDSDDEDGDGEEDSEDDASPEPSSKEASPSASPTPEPSPTEADDEEPAPEESPESSPSP